MKKMLLIQILILLCYCNIYSKDKDTMEVITKEITVSALRYPEQIIEVPMAINVIYKDALSAIKGMGIEEPLKAVPGVIAQTRAGAQDLRITIRGFGARGAGDRSNSGTSRGIRFYTNGIPETEPDGRTSFDFLDFSSASSIEVIRSNSSAIWGNAAGGVVSINTFPENNRTTLNLSLFGGSFGYQKYFMNATAKLDNGLIYTNLSTSKYDGFRQNSEAEKYLLDIGFRTQLNEASYLNVFTNAALNKFNIPGPLTQSMFDTAFKNANTTYLARQERRNNRLFRMGLNIDYFFDDANSINGTFFVSPKYLQRSERGTFRDFTRYHLGANTIYKNAFAINNELSNVLLAGFDEQYQDGAILFYSLSTDNGRGNELKANKKEGANNFGAFVQNEILWNDKVSIVLGLRYDNITYYNQDFMKLNFKEDKSFENIIPKFGISYRLDDKHTIYLNYGGGIEVPAGNETDPEESKDTIHLLNPLLDAIKSQTFEAGSKNIFWTQDGFIRLFKFDIAAYYIKITNDIIPYQNGKFYFTAGKTSRMGIEAGVELLLDYGLSLSSAVTYMNSKYDNYKIDSVHYDTTKAGIYADFDGNKVAGIPDLFYNFSLKYSIEQLNSFLEINIEGIRWYYADDANLFRVPSYNIFNLRAGLAQPLKFLENYFISFFISINNILSEKYAASAFINPDLEKNTNAPVFLEPGMPRNFVFGISLAWK